VLWPTNRLSVKGRQQRVKCAQSGKATAGAIAVRQLLALMEIGHPAGQELAAQGRLHQDLRHGEIPLDPQDLEPLPAKRMENVHDFRVLGVAGIM